MPWKFSNILAIRYHNLVAALQFLNRSSSHNSDHCQMVKAPLTQSWSTVLTNYYSGWTLLRCPEIKKVKGLGSAPQCGDLPPNYRARTRLTATVPVGWPWHHKKEAASYPKAREGSWSGNLDWLELCIYIMNCPCDYKRFLFDKYTL